MINMKYGCGNYAMINAAGTAVDIDKTKPASNTRSLVRAWL
jgi:hypothetical protein